MSQYCVQGWESRINGFFSMKDVNVTGRRSGGSELLALDIDNPGEDGLFNFRGIKPVGHYIGATGNRDLDLLGFDAEILDDGTTRFYFVNQRPPVGAFNKIIDASEIGANSTIEIFEMKKGQDEMQHIRTIFSSEIWTPNRVAAVGDESGAFLVTNDHSVKVGWVCTSLRTCKNTTNMYKPSAENSTTSSAAETSHTAMKQGPATPPTTATKTTPPRPPPHHLLPASPSTCPS